MIPQSVCLVRLRITNEVSELPIQAHVALLECCLPGEEEEILVHLDLLEVEFFDDECVVIVYRLRDQDSKSRFKICAHKLIVIERF